MKKKAKPSKRDRLGNKVARIQDKPAVYAFRLQPSLVKAIDSKAKASRESRTEFVVRMLSLAVGRRLQ